MKRFICLLSLILFIATAAFAESEKPPLHSPTVEKMIRDSVRVILYDAPQDDLNALLKHKSRFFDILEQVDNPEMRVERLKNLTLLHPRSILSVFILLDVARYYMRQMRFEEANFVVENTLDSLANYSEVYGSQINPFRSFKGCLLIRFGEYQQAREVFLDLYQRRAGGSAYFTNEEYHEWFIPYCKQLREKFPFLGLDPQPTEEAYILRGISGEWVLWMVDLIDGYYLGKEGNSYENMQHERTEQIKRGE